MVRKTFLIFSSLLLLVNFRASLVEAQKPVRIDKARKIMAAAPEGLIAEGVHYYDLSIQLPAQIVLKLYDQSKTKIADVTIAENPIDKSILHKISNTSGEEAWIRSESKQTENQVLYSITSSEENKLNVRFKKVSGKPAGRTIAISEVEVDDGRGWQQLSIAEIRSALPGWSSAKAESTDREQFLSDRNPFFKLEDDLFFSTQLQKVLKAVMRNFVALQKMGDENKTSPGQGFKNNTGFEPVIDDPGEGGCKVNCFRMSAIIPTYTCDGGFWSGCSCPQAQGVWLIAECGLSLHCRVDCGRFSNGGS